MRTITSLSAVATVGLVLGLLGPTASNADQADPAGPAVSGDVSVSAPSRAGGLMVSTTDGETRVVRFGEDMTTQQALGAAERWESRPGVTGVELDYVRSAVEAPPVQVNDPLVSLQTNIWDAGRPGGGHSTRAPGFWTRTRGSSTVRVAVLDTGMTAHPDLTWGAGRDIVDRDDDPTDPGPGPTKATGFHGTHVAGTVAARADNGIGVVGVAPGVTIVPVRVLDGAGDGFDSDIAAGILWASGVPVQGVTNPAPVHVITMSLAGAGGCGPTLAGAINTARSRGIVVLAAAGNDGEDASGYAPASCPGVITVGATDAGGARASFSNFGATVDISAPGVNVYSTARRPSDGAYGYSYQSGTSMAAPAVAGAAALLASTGLSGAQIEGVLPRMVTPATSPGTAGILDLRPAPVPTAVRISTTVSVTVASRASRQKWAVLRIRLRATTGARPAGRIRVYDGTTVIRRATVSSGRRGDITLKTPRLRGKGVHRLRVAYLGEGQFNPSRSVVRKVRVR